MSQIQNSSLQPDLIGRIRTARTIHGHTEETGVSQIFTCVTEKRMTDGRKEEIPV